MRAGMGGRMGGRDGGLGVEAQEWGLGWEGRDEGTGMGAQG